MAHIADRLYEKKWGLSITYSYPRVHIEGVSWNDTVKMFDVKKFARQLSEMGVGYILWAALHNSEHMNVPNATYEKIAGTKPGEITSTRDIILELYEELSKYDIDLYLYFPANGPRVESEVTRKLGFFYDYAEVFTLEGNKPLPEGRLSDEYTARWSSVLHEIAERYKGKVKGYWIDNCSVLLGFNQHKMKPFFDAVKTADPNAIITFNKGVAPALRKWYEKEDYTAGEFNEFEYIPEGRFTEGLQNHIFGPMGSKWGKADARYSREYMLDYIRKVNKAGAAVTVNVKIYADGSLEEVQKNSLMLADL